MHRLESCDPRRRKGQRRLSAATCVAVVLSVSASAFAQEYVEYKSMQDRFGATFPTQPKVTESMFKSQFGSMLCWFLAVSVLSFLLQLQD